MARIQSVLVVGVGSIGERHVRCFLATGRAKIAICEVNDDRREQVAQRYSIAQTWKSLDEFIADGGPTEFTAAIICTPAHTHVPMARKLTAAGLHLLIEKPLSTSLAGVDHLLAEVADRGTVAGVAYVLRAHPLLENMKRALDSGEFGKPLELVAVGGQHFPTYRPAYREIYYRDRATGGGAIQDALTHWLNLGEWFVGGANRVVADAAHLALPGVDVEDTVHVLARHGTVLANYSLNQHQAPNELTVTIVCERGTLRFEAHAQRWRQMAVPGESWVDEEQALERDDLFTLQAEAFLEALDGRRPVLCSLTDGQRTLRANLAILQSCETQAWVDC